MMRSTHLMYVLLLGMATLIFFGSRNTENSPFAMAHASLAIPYVNEVNGDCSCSTSSPRALWNPSEYALNDYERLLFDFVLNRKYAKAGWCMDKKIRDTGPFAKGTYFGVHPAVRMYYSPRMMYWLTGDPKYWDWKKDGISPAPKKRKPRTGKVPDGAIIIKEMFTPPGDLYEELEAVLKDRGACATEEAMEGLVAKLISSYTIMVRDSKGSKDGWFWSGVNPPNLNQTVAEAIEAGLTSYQGPPDSGFSIACTRCHGSAAAQHTFSSLNNIKGFNEDDNLLEFQTDVSWKREGLLDGFPLNQLTNTDGETCIKDELTVKELREILELPPLMRPWADNSIPGFEVFVNEHLREVDPNRNYYTANPLKSINAEFATNFPEIKGMTVQNTRGFPFQWADHVPPTPTNTEHYITSDNCLGCHGGLGGVPYDVTMFVQTGPNYGNGYNISEYGEWRWSPMGLAGRDPIFYAQLETEMKFLEEDAANNRLKGTLTQNKDAVTNACTSCHGAMGQRQLAKDAAKNPHLDKNFNVEYTYLEEPLTSAAPKSPYAQYTKYGELAREGISCAVCHHITEPSEKQIQDWTPKEGWLEGKADKELAYFLFHNNTGRYEEGPADEFYGPFKDVKTKPMEHILGVRPVHNDFTTNSQLCGTCHTINLPNIGMEEDKFPVLTASETDSILAQYNHSIEQATFLEWQNSSFGFTVDGRMGKDFQSCQGCHMPNDFETMASDIRRGSAVVRDSIKIDQLTTKIATIQDQDYADAEHLLPTEEITVKSRSDYKRHELVGLNVFLLEMFDQFPDILGVDKSDYMTSATNGNSFAIENMVRSAQTETVDIAVKLDRLTAKDTLPIHIAVTNKTGHRYPSGVGFRRSFLEVLVMEGNQVIWGSGRTNSVGVIVDEDGNPLPTEFLPDAKTYQKHYQVVRSQKEVQIYEELNTNQDNEFTTSFVHRVHPVKDNRLLPRGWRFSGNFESQGKLMQEFMQATDPEHVGDDPDYRDAGEDFKGQDNIKYMVKIPANINMDKVTVKVTMYSQSIPPFWLYEKFRTAPEGDATKRLYYLTSHLNLDDTPMKDWKLPLVSVEKAYGK